MSQVERQNWEDMREFFEDDDGSLPDIFIENLDPESIPKIFEMLWKRGRDVTAGRAMYHDCRENQSKPLENAREVARLVLDGKAESPHVVLADLEFEGTTIPDLGVCLYADGIILDYRMGTDWGPQQLTSMLGLLWEIATFAPSMDVVHQDAGERFSSAWRRFAETRGVI